MNMANIPNYPDKFITVRGIRTRYWDAGKGAHAIVFVHGFTGSLLSWTPALPHFEKKCRVIALDLPGHGLTGKPKARYDYPFFSAFLKDFLSALKIDKCSLVGHSMGGVIGLLFTVTHPDIVQKLVLVAPALLTKASMAHRLVSLPFIGERLFKAPKTTEDVQNSYKDLTYKYYEYDPGQLKDYLGFYNSPGYQGAMLRYLRSGITFFGFRPGLLRTYEQLKQKIRMIKIPVFVVWGKQDKVIPFEASNDLKQLIPHMKLLAIDECGHGPVWEYPDLFNKNLNKFLSGRNDNV